MTAEIRKIVAQYGRLAVDVTALSDEDDLYCVGLKSHASVNVMLAEHLQVGGRDPCGPRRADARRHPVFIDLD